MTIINLSRRTFLASAGSSLALAVAGCSTVPETRPEHAAAPRLSPVPDAPKAAPTDYPAEVLEMYRALPDEQFPVPAANVKRLDPAFYRTVVDYHTQEAPGTVVVDTPHRYLYHVHGDGTATRYGVGIGRAGFEWSGVAHVAYGRKWPVWTPPTAMIARQPQLEKWREGQPPGIKNALGARALYIHQGNTDTLYRIHGTDQAETIGKAVSSGCVRLLHQDVIHLYDNVKWGSAVVVIA